MLKTQGFKGLIGVQGARFCEHGVPGFESTGYIVSRVSGYGAHSFSLTPTLTV